MELQERNELPIDQMILCAMKARENAYTPYSGFKVGAALLTEEGEIIGGCNIENAAYSPGICAERCAIAKAVSEGKRSWRAIAVIGGQASDQSVTSQTGVEGYAYPCGVCRQVMREFANPESFWVIVAKSRTEYRLHRLEELLPESFGPDNLKNGEKG